MSAFICNDKTINRILSYLFWCKGDFLKNDINRILNKLGYSVRTNEESQKLGEAIRELNFRSIAERYGQKAEKEDRKIIGEYKFKNEDCSKEQAYQHLRCLTYQCCEGECDKDKIYLMLEELERVLAYSIAQDKLDESDYEWEAK